MVLEPLQLLTYMMYYSNHLLHSSSTATTAIRHLSPTITTALVRCAITPDLEPRADVKKRHASPRSSSEQL